jgi:hypothetical protein
LHVPGLDVTERDRIRDFHPFPLPLRPLCPPPTGLLLPTTLTRETAQATPKLWRATLFSDNCIPLEVQLHICDIWLSRSRGYPLSIRTNRPLGGLSSLQKILSAVVPHQARWEHLTLLMNGFTLGPSLEGGSQSWLANIYLSLSPLYIPWYLFNFALQP